MVDGNGFAAGVLEFGGNAELPGALRDIGSRRLRGAGHCCKIQTTAQGCSDDAISAPADQSLRPCGMARPPCGSGVRFASSSRRAPSPIRQLSETTPGRITSCCPEPVPFNLGTI